MRDLGLHIERLLLDAGIVAAGWLAWALHNPLDAYLLLGGAVLLTLRIVLAYRELRRTKRYG